MHALLLTDHPHGAAAVLPALERLDIMSTSAGLADPRAAAEADCVIVDATQDLTAAVAACRSEGLRSLEIPVLVVAPMHVLAVLKVSWGFEDWVLPDCGAAELGARLRLAVELHARAVPNRAAAGLALDPTSYRVTVNGRVLDLTYTEFELLRALLDRPNQVWTRAALLRDAWGYEHPGGTRTVDVHIRRLRAKLGPEVASCLQTVRKVGYKLVLPERGEAGIQPTRGEPPSTASAGGAMIGGGHGGSQGASVVGSRDHARAGGERVPGIG